LTSLKRWQDIVEVGGRAKSIGPQGGADCLGPSLLGVEELLPCAFREVSDGSFSNPILKMGIDSAKSDLLP